MIFKRVVVGIDGSRAGWSAKDYAFELGERLSAPVVGVHVIDSRLLEESFLEDLAGVLGFTYYLGISQKVRDFFEEQANALIEEFLSEGRQRGIRVSSFQTVGIPYEELVNQADPEDLLVIGRRGNRPVRGFLLSSTAEVVSRRSKAPVMLTPEEKREIKSICVAYDGGELSKRALFLGEELSKMYNASLHALYVGDRKVETPSHTELLVEQGLPEERIVTHCRERGVDLLLMGAYSKGRVRELFLGSVTSFVMHHIDVPLLLVK
ncbi:MAG: universal stress protein [Aquificaceae bacterium]|nr:universal stress protein [Aquificaceae bacterium]